MVTKDAVSMDFRKQALGYGLTTAERNGPTKFCTIKSLEQENAWLKEQLAHILRKNE
jgi:hypothetical protein